MNVIEVGLVHVAPVINQQIITSAQFETSIKVNV